MADPPPQPDLPSNGAAPPPPPLETLTTAKRQRRPSVRLGEIGGQHVAPLIQESNPFRRTKQLRAPGQHREPSKVSSSSSKIRPLTNVVAGDHHDGAAEEKGFQLHHDHSGGGGEEKLDSFAVIRRGNRDGKIRRGGGGGGPAVVRRVRTNWFSKVEDGAVREGAELKSSEEEEVGDEEDYGGFEDDLGREDSDSPVREQSHSDRRGGGRVRVSESRDVGLAGAANVEEDAPSGTDGRGWEQGRLRGGGVRSWLNGLGLGRYAPVFEIHEVDEEVLPHITLEDLRDMGINAVGSRRKMYCAIQKLGKGFS